MSDELENRFEGAPKDLHWLVKIFEDVFDAKDAEIHNLEAELASLRARPQEPGLSKEWQ